MRRWPARVRAAARRRPLITDALVTVGLALLGLLAVRVGIDTAPPTYSPPPSPVVLALALGLIVPLAWRRRFPLTVLVVVTIVFFPYRIEAIPDLTVSVVVWWLALYSAGAYGDRRWRDWVRATNVIAALVFLTYRLVTVGGALIHGKYLVQAVFIVLFNLFFVVAAWVFGNTMAARRDHEAALVERARQLEEEREEKARRAVFDERVRIARELHDVVAHHVSVMGVQAGAARRVLRQHPDKAEDALSSIEGASRQAVMELHRLLDFLRREGDADGLSPQPTLDDLDTLAHDVRRAGLAVEVHTEGERRPLPPTLDHSAYRIVQEALTNCVKHSSGTRADVLVRYGPATLEVEVVDDGVGPGARTPPGRGHGLIGMRERARLHGGELRAGPRPGGGFQVHVRLPLNGATRQ